MKGLLGGGLGVEEGSSAESLVGEDEEELEEGGKWLGPREALPEDAEDQEERGEQGGHVAPGHGPMQLREGEQGGRPFKLGPHHCGGSIHKVGPQDEGEVLCLTKEEGEGGVRREQVLGGHEEALPQVDMAQLGG